MFLSALLLFWIQLVIAKMLLPRLGGTPAVWNTCMLFFQVMLLAGYSYVLVTTTWIGARTQAVLQIVLLLLSALYLPFALAGDLGSEPSSLLFGVTTYITTEIAPTPLLWTIPLALYLITFILAFARKQFAYERLASYAVGGLALLLALVIATTATEPTAAIVLLHLAFFFVAALLCHHKLASDRPAARHLPNFYLCLAVGGMLGGLFNTLIAPTIFDTIIEYPALVVLACVIRRRDDTKQDSTSDRLLDVALPACMGLLTVTLALLVARYDVSEVAAIAVVFGVPLMLINHRFRTRPVRFALAVGAVLLGSVVYSETHNRTLHVERNFFGSLSVRFDPGSATRILYHGNTVHGRQFIDPNREREPLSYSHKRLRV